MAISAVALFLPGLVAVAAGTPPVGYFETSFDVIPAYARIDVIAQRTRMPEAFAIARAGVDKRGFTIDPREEAWQVYIPGDCVPDMRCGVLVWVPAEDGRHMRTDWREILDDEHVIFVAAMRSGNDHDTFRRRIPLALTGLAGIVTAYDIDRSRVYVGGSSGGSGQAQILAFAFPDIFRGAILNAGYYDPAAGEILSPPAPLDEQLRQVPVVYVVGRQETSRGGITSASASHMPNSASRKPCTLPTPRQGHRQIDAAKLRRALEFFDSP